MILTAITFLIILTVLVLIHEFGHFMAARMIGVKVEEFGMGLPPKIIGKKFGETVYSLNWLPIGGFVRLAGEDQDPEAHKGFPRDTAKHFFWARSKKERAVILTAGVFMNFALAVAITAGLLVHGVQEPSGKIYVEKVAPGSPAQTAGLLPKDTILSVATGLGDPIPLHTPKDLISFVNDQKGHELMFAIIRDGQPLTITAVPRVEVPEGEGPLGVVISDLELHKYPLSQAPGKALTLNLQRAWDMLASLGTTIFRLITLQSPQADITGPLGIAQYTGQALRFGWLAVLEFASILSLNLAVLNVLPIPALDGGRLAFVFFEKIIGRKIRPAFERSTHQVGMIVLFALIFLVTIGDVLRIFKGG